MPKLIVCKNAFDQKSVLVDNAQQLLEIVRSEYYARVIDSYRKTGDEMAKKYMLGCIFQGVRNDESVETHLAHDLRPSGWVFLDDDRPHSEISADERHRAVEERLAQLGMSGIPHIAMRSSSYKYHLLVPFLDKTKSLLENHLMWEKIFDGVLVLDASTRNVNRITFFCGEIYTGDKSLNYFFENDFSVNVDESMNVSSATAQPESSNADSQLDEIAASITRQLNGGSLVVAQGNRNNMLYAVARQMAYLDGITESDIVDALRSLQFYGLPEREAVAAIRSALGHEKTLLYKLPDELQQALEELESEPEMTHTPQQPEGDSCQWSVADEQVETPELIKLFAELVPENTREAVAAMVFSPLGTYLNNSVKIYDVSGKRRNIQFSTIVVGNSSSGKGFSDMISDLITERHRQKDLTQWALLTKWQEQKRATAKGDPQPPKPQALIRLLPPNLTEPSLLERLSAIQSIDGRCYIKCSEIDDLRKLQSAATRLGAGQEVILSAFDTASYGALRVSADAISAQTVMSVNILASSTFPGTQEFFHAGIERGTVGRCDFCIVKDAFDVVPRYQDPTPEFYHQLDIYLDRLETATGEIVSEDIDRVIEQIRLSYSHPESPLSYHHNPEHYKLSHRQLLITKQKATILYICNDYQWDPAWEPWLFHAFYYGMRCKLNIFAADIAAWERKQRMATTHNITARRPKGELSQLGDANGLFTLADLVNLKRSQNPNATDEELTRKAKTLIRTWILRKHIAPTGNDGEYQKI